MNRLLLVRHGEALGAEGRVTGHLDLPLSPEGATAIARLAASWSGPPPDRLIASDLARAAGSAQILATSLGVPMETDRRLRELSFGEWEGLRWDELQRRDPERFAAWGAGWWELAPPGGETLDELQRRTLAWLDDCQGRGDRQVLAVLHGGSLRALLAGLGLVEREALFDRPIGLARVTTLRRPRHAWELVDLDCESFVPAS